jgi:formimidoylglutamate deiminase
MKSEQQRAGSSRYNDEMQSYESVFCRSAYLPTGWANNVRIELDQRGFITGIRCDVKSEEAAFMAAGPVMPGMPNVHSHSFQRAMAGLCERSVERKDSFWSWRETMYKFVQSLEPEDVEAIATQLYVDCLRNGYTAIGEFHYLHHRPDGSQYEAATELADRHVLAARRAGIGLTLLPVLYTHGGFDGQALVGGQRRFHHANTDYLEFVRAVVQHAGQEQDVRVGFAAHSLRAVGVDQLQEMLAEVSRIDASMPIHIHVAEQQAEVDDCLKVLGRRPVDFLLSEIGVDQRWCLIHATHMTPEETVALAQSGAVAGLCPTTEANLGDGLFPARRFQEAEGRFAIGSDSHVSVSPWEELRMLEYGQRLHWQQRNVLADTHASTGSALFAAALAGGKQALGRPMGQIAIGAVADLIIIDDSVVEMVGRTRESLLDTLVFCGDCSMIRDVLVAGKHVIQEGRHPDEESIGHSYRDSVRRIVRSL